MEQREVVAGGGDGALTADEFDTDSAANPLYRTQQQTADLAGGANVSSSAGVEVVVGNFNEAHASIALGKFAQAPFSQQRFGLAAVYSARGDGAILGDDVVGDSLDAFEAMVSNGGGREVDGRGGFAEVEGYRLRIELAGEDGREQMLAGVLLDVVEAAGPIDGSLNGGSGKQRLAGEVPDLSLVVLLHAFDGHFEGGSVARGSGEEASVVRLAAAGGVEI